MEEPSASSAGLETQEFNIRRSSWFVRNLTVQGSSDEKYNYTFILYAFAPGYFVGGNLVFVDGCCTTHRLAQSSCRCAPAHL
jgi:hypothetical protein